MAHPPLVVLTGGIASGKSTASERFAELGIQVVDTDQLARDVVAPGQPALQEIADQLGARFILANGELDRTALRAHVFAHPQARRQLEAITHPRIRQLAMQLCSEATSPYVLLVVPLFVESGRAYPAWKTLVVDLPEALQRQRLAQRDGLDEAAIERILQAQASRAERLAVADWVLDNRGTAEALRQQVDTAHQTLLRQLPG